MYIDAAIKERKNMHLGVGRTIRDSQDPGLAANEKPSEGYTFQQTNKITIQLQGYLGRETIQFAEDIAGFGCRTGFSLIWFAIVCDYGEHMGGGESSVALSLHFK